MDWKKVQGSGKTIHPMMNIKANTITIKRMEKASIDGATGTFTMGSLEMICDKGLVKWTGQQGKSMKVIGRMGFKMVLAHCIF